MTTTLAPSHGVTLRQLANRVLALTLLTLCLWLAWTFPVAGPVLTIGLAAYFALLLVRPSAWMIVLPAALPVLELTFWSGRLFFGEFDLLVLTTLASGLWHGGAWLRMIDRGTRAVGLLLLATQGAVTLHGLLPLHTPISGSWTDYFASTNALREFRGVLWALLLWPMLGAARARGEDLQRWLAAGLIVGLAAAFATIIWERGLFTGLFNFHHPYRISGWFFSMHTGGAAIDAFLAMSVPFALAPLLLWRRATIRVVAPLLVLVALYAFYVTYSRANYPALLVMLTILLWGIASNLSWPYASAGRTRRQIRMAAVTGGTLALAVLVLSAYVLGPQIASRFTSTRADLDDRLQHWSGIVDAAMQYPAATWIGRGKGRFPHDYYWLKQTGGQHLALASHVDENGDGFIRFTPSDRDGNLFLQQRFDRTASNQYRLTLSLRVPGGRKETLLIEFCERHILKYRTECRWSKVKVPKSDGEWLALSTPVNLKGLGLPRFGPFARPLDVSLMNRGIKTGLDIGSVQLLSAEGEPLLRNADFSAGWDHWFLTYGDHLRWHIKNVFVYWFYEGGIVHLGLMLAIGLFVVSRLGGAARRGDLFALLALTGILGTIMVGLFDSLFDDMRISMMFFLVTGAALIGRPVDPVALVIPGWVTRQRLLLAGKAAAVLLAGIAVLMLVLPSLFRPLEVRLSLWAEQRGSPLMKVLSPARDEVQNQIRSQLAPWQPLAAGDLPAGEVRIGTRVFKNLQDAASALRNGDELQIGAGIYRTPLVISADDVTITGSGHVVIERKAAMGKGAIITKGDDIRISNIECRNIHVGDRNGACVRHQGRNLTLHHVYFHSSEQGLLTGKKPGRVHISDSRFEQLGKLGRAHGIYVGRDGELILEDSLVLAAKSWGHEVKSRAAVTRIRRSVIASLGSNDNRLIDVPHGGLLEITDSVLQQGPASGDDSAIGFALEGRPHASHKVVMDGNIVILERDGSDRLLHAGDADPILRLSNNAFINTDIDEDQDAGNLYFDSREEAGLQPFPHLPAIPR